LVTFGEILLRLATPGAQRLSQATHFDVTFAGAEINAAVAAARWGFPARFITALPENPWAEIVAARLREAEVALVAQSVRSSRLGTYFVEHGFGARPARVVYDRARSAFATLAADCYRWPALLRGGAWFHTTGITPAVSREARRACADALRAARTARLPTSFDVNFRRNLWTLAQAARFLRPLVRNVDLLMGAEDVFTGILGIKSTGVLGSDGQPRAEAIVALCEEITASYRVGAVLVSLRHSGADGRLTLAAALYLQGRLLLSRTHAIDVVDRLGAGDAMAGVLIAGLHHGLPPQRALEEAVAAAALKHTTMGDFIATSREEVRAGLAAGRRGRVNR
jgi:2-dehydro-3-deoxygluconokinase